MSIIQKRRKARRRGRPISTTIPPDEGTILLRRNDFPTMEGISIRQGYYLYEVLVVDEEKEEIYLELQWANLSSTAIIYAFRRIDPDFLSNLRLVCVNAVKVRGTELPMQETAYFWEMERLKGYTYVNRKFQYNLKGGTV